MWNLNLKKVWGENTAIFLWRYFPCLMILPSASPGLYSKSTIRLLWTIPGNNSGSYWCPRHWIKFYPIYFFTQPCLHKNSGNPDFRQNPLVFRPLLSIFLTFYLILLQSSLKCDAKARQTTRYRWHFSPNPILAKYCRLSDILPIDSILKHFRVKNGHIMRYSGHDLVKTGISLWRIPCFRFLRSAHDRFQ